MTVAGFNEITHFKLYLTGQIGSHVCNEMLSLDAHGV